MRKRKIHSIRTDEPGRWRPGMTIQHWIGNPRNTRKVPPPRQFATGICTAVEAIRILRTGSATLNHPAVDVWVEGVQLAPSVVLQLIENDGLTPVEFSAWFVPPQDPEFTGRIIHWSGLTYQPHKN